MHLGIVLYQVHRLQVYFFIGINFLWGFAEVYHQQRQNYHVCPVLGLFYPLPTHSAGLHYPLPEMPYSAFSSNLAAISHLCGSWTTAHWPQHSDEPLGEVSGWHQPDGIGGCGCVVDGTFCLYTVCHVEQIQKRSHPAYYFILCTSRMMWQGSNPRCTHTVMADALSSSYFRF